MISCSLTIVLAMIAALSSVSSAFVPLKTTSTLSRPSTSLFGVEDIKNRDVDPNNLFQSTWNGGAFAKREGEAAKIASKIKSVKDLGWTEPPKRPGGTRPRHRAYGGTTEMPIQLKPNYDPTNPKCVEKWLSLDEFYGLVRDSSPAADTVFVALAGGKSCAERDICEQKIAEWRSGGPKGNAFDEGKFLKSVQQGRTDLAIGWGLFLGVNSFFASCIVFPTNPAAKALESGLAQIQSMI